MKTNFLLITTAILLSTHIIKTDDTEKKQSKFTQSEGFFSIYPWDTMKKKFNIKGDSYDALKDEVLANEKKYSDYNAFYHATNIQNFIFILLHTSLSQIEKNWLGNTSFYLFRNPKDFFQKNISVKDFLIEYYFGNKYNGLFDHDPQIRTWELATNVSLVACTAHKEGESTFYYLTSNQSMMANFEELYTFYTGVLKEYNQTLFEPTKKDDPFAQSQDLVKEYVFIKLKNLNSLIEKETSGGALFQIMIPKLIVDDCTYLCTMFGIPIIKQFKEITDGWDSTYKFYTKSSPFLQLLEIDPKTLNTMVEEKGEFSLLEVMQARIFLKKEYFDVNPIPGQGLQNKIKMNLFYTMKPSLFNTIKDLIYILAQTILQEAKARVNKESYEKWLETSNIKNEVIKIHDAMLRKLKNGKTEAYEAISELLTFGIAFDFFVLVAAQERLKSNDSKERFSGYGLLEDLVKKKAITSEQAEKILNDFKESLGDQYNFFVRKLSKLKNI